MLPKLLDWARERYPKDPSDSDFAYKQSIRAKACDAARGILPAATLSNVGVYGSGQAFEALLLRMRAHPLPEAVEYAAMMLEELRKVIPSFVARVDRPDRGGVWSEYLSERRHDTAELVHRLFGAAEPEPRPSVTLTDFDPDAEDKLLAAVCYPHTQLPDDQILAACARWASTSAVELLRAYVGSATTVVTAPATRSNASTTASTSSPTTACSATCNATGCSRSSGSRCARCTATTFPKRSTKPGSAIEFDDAMARSASLYDALVDRFPEQASYAVSLAYRIRFTMQINAREAMHLIELRTMPSGHPAYRQVAQEMHRLIAEQAGHRAIADAMSYVDHTTYELERLAAERAADARRTADPSAEIFAAASDRSTRVGAGHGSSGASA